jgi:hypothetical protein
MALKVKLQTAIVGLFFFRGEVTGRQLSTDSMVLDALAAKPMSGAIRISAGAGISIQLDPGTLFFLTVHTGLLWSSGGYLVLPEDLDFALDLKI